MSPSLLVTILIFMSFYTDPHGRWVGDVGNEIEIRYVKECIKRWTCSRWVNVSIRVTASGIFPAIFQKASISMLA